jgi:hypothetical protein
MAAVSALSLNKNLNLEPVDQPSLLRICFSVSPFVPQRMPECARVLADAGMDDDTANRDGASGAWLLLAEVSAQDPSAASWQFLQVGSRASPRQTLKEL